MKRYEKFVILLLALMILAWTTPFIGRIQMAREYGIDIPLHVSAYWRSINTLMFALANAGAGVWLFAESPRHAANRWIWCFFGILFGLIGVITFYAILIYRNTRPENPET